MTTVRKLERAAAAHRSTRDRLALEIRAAHAEGLSLRKIADVVDVSHEQVRRILSR